MADNAPATAEEFVTNYGVAPDVAASLAAQANAMSGRSGYAAKAEAEHSMDHYVPPAPTAPQFQGNATAARAEWDQLTADRAAGKISNFQWNDPSAVARRDALVATIAGVPQTEKPTIQQLTDMAIAHDQKPMADALAQHFAPPAAAHEYKFPYVEGTPTDEMIASDSALKAALFAEKLPANMVERIATNLRSAVAAEANEVPAAMQSRLDGQKARLTAMWAKSGEGTFEANIAIVDAFLEQLGAKDQALRNFIANAAPRLTPIDIDSLLQLARHRGAKS